MLAKTNRFPYYEQSQTPKPISKYYYGNFGSLTKNPNHTISPLNYRQNTSYRLKRIPKTPSLNRRKLNPTSPSKSIWQREIYVMLDGSPSSEENKSGGFLYSFSTKEISRKSAIKTFQEFLDECTLNLDSPVKLKFAFTQEGSIIKSLLQIPPNCSLVLVSQSANFKGFLDYPPSQQTIDSFFRESNSKLSQFKSRRSLERFLPENPIKSSPILNKFRPVKKMTRIEYLQELKIKMGQLAFRIDSELPKLESKVARELALEYRFSEGDIYKLYARYKTMMLVSSMDNLEYKLKNGISKSSFVETLMLDSSGGKAHILFEKIFNSLDEDKDGYLRWEEFLKGMHLITLGTAEEKIDFFFELYDTDGNRSLSYEEIRDLCSLELYFATEDKILEYLTESFAELIFEMTKVKVGEEISKEELKELLMTATDEPLIDMFCSFSFVNN